MKTSAYFVLALAVLAPHLLAQTDESLVTMPIPQKVRMSADVAEKLLIHKVDPDTCLHVAMAARVIGTVVVAIVIDTNGNVLHPRIVSGPKMLQRVVLDAVRKYKYRPYLLNTTAVEVETTVSVPFDTGKGCASE